MVFPYLEYPLFFLVFRFFLLADFLKMSPAVFKKIISEVKSLDSFKDNRSFSCIDLSPTFDASPNSSIEIFIII